MLWRHYGGEQVNKTSTGDISMLFVLLCTKIKNPFTLGAVHGGNIWEFHYLLHSVVSAGTLSLEAVLWGWLPFSPESFWLVSSWWLQAVCFSPPCILLCSISVFLKNRNLFQALYFLHVSGIIVFHPAADPLPCVAFERDRASSVYALATTCCLEEQLCCSSGAVPQQSCPWCEMLPLLTRVWADRHCFQSCTHAKSWPCWLSVPETLYVSSILSTGRVWWTDLGPEKLSGVTGGKVNLR